MMLRVVVTLLLVKAGFSDCSGRTPLQSGSCTLLCTDCKSLDGNVSCSGSQEIRENSQNGRCELWTRIYPCDPAQCPPASKVDRLCAIDNPSPTRLVEEDCLGAPTPQMTPVADDTDLGVPTLTITIIVISSIMFIVCCVTATWLLVYGLNCTTSPSKDFETDVTDTVESDRFDRNNPWHEDHHNHDSDHHDEHADDEHHLKLYARMGSINELHAHKIPHHHHESPRSPRQHHHQHHHNHDSSSKLQHKLPQEYDETGGNGARKKHTGHAHDNVEPENVAVQLKDIERAEGRKIVEKRWYHGQTPEDIIKMIQDGRIGVSEVLRHVTDQNASEDRIARSDARDIMAGLRKLNLAGDPEAPASPRTTIKRFSDKDQEPDVLAHGDRHHHQHQHNHHQHTEHTHARVLDVHAGDKHK